MRNYLTWGGVDTRTMGVYISGPGRFSGPTRSFDFISVPNKDGDLLGVNTRLENCTITYPAFICNNFEQNVRKLKAALYTDSLLFKGWKKLYDSYDLDVYRLAVYQGPFEPNVTSTLDAGSFDLTFICKPQIYFTSGDTEVKFTSTGTLYNSTLFDAKPYLRVYGTGTIKISSVFGYSNTITVSTNDLYTEIDCEAMECYRGTQSLNQYVSFSQNDFPVLMPQTNTITLGTGITQVFIQPRWYTV